MKFCSARGSRYWVPAYLADAAAASRVEHASASHNSNSQQINNEIVIFFFIHWLYFVWSVIDNCRWRNLENSFNNLESCVLWPEQYCCFCCLLKLIHIKLHFQLSRSEEKNGACLCFAIESSPSGNKMTKIVVFV